MEFKRIISIVIPVDIYLPNISILVQQMNGHHLNLLKELSKNNKLSQRELTKYRLMPLLYFRSKDEDDFNNWHKDISMRNREAGQPIIYIYVKKWRKHSSIEELKIAAVA